MEDLNRTNLSTNEQTIVFMKRRSTTTQIRQAIRHRFAALVLFADPQDEKQNSESVDDRINDEDNPICVLLLPYSDVQKIFSANLSAGIVFEEKRLRLISHLQEIPVHLPNVFGLIRGDEEEERFVMIGIELARREEEKVIEQIIRIFQKQIQRRWKPRFVFLSLLFI